MYLTILWTWFSVVPLIAGSKISQWNKSNQFSIIECANVESMHADRWQLCSRIYAEINYNASSIFINKQNHTTENCH